MRFPLDQQPALPSGCRPWFGMYERPSSANIPSASIADTEPLSIIDEIDALHERCGIYTKPEVVERILDSVGWRADVDLSALRLLEPAAGNGAFVAEAAKRLVASFIRHGKPLRAEFLTDRIAAFELHRREAYRARSHVMRVLRESGLRRRTAEICARSWIRHADFLIATVPLGSFTHAVGNPPYVRWSKIPKLLKARYAGRLPDNMTGGDLFLPFLDRAFELLGADGRAGFICSDRWRFMAFAEAFRNKWLPLLDIQSELAMPAVDAFQRDVDSYPTILIATKRATRAPSTTRPATARSRTLAELGCVIRVGPALGHTPAFVLNPDEHNVENRLLRPWVDGSEVTEGAVKYRGHRIVVMYDSDGKLIDPEKFPRLSARLERFRESLAKRSIVTNGAPWYRPIDRVRAVDWARPKLLVPELAKIPRVAIDRTGAIPSHGVYAIFVRDDDVEALYEKLRDGKLANALDGIAPKVKGGYVRCYRRFLELAPVR